MGWEEFASKGQEVLFRKLPEVISEAMQVAFETATPPATIKEERAKSPDVRTDETSELKAPEGGE